MGAGGAEALVEHLREAAQGGVPEDGEDEDEEKPAGGDQAVFVEAHRGWSEPGETVTSVLTELAM